MIKEFLDFEDYANSKLCNAWVATAIVGAAVVGGVSQYLAADKAADAQVNATNKAADTTLQMYHQTRADLDPYRAVGKVGIDEMTRRLPDLTAPISIDPDVLKDSDYYRFASKEGQRAVTNSAAFRGLGSSGAALKGAISFAEGLATNTYKDAWNMENTNKTNAYNRLKGLIDTGATAATATGTAGTSAAKTAGDAYIGGGNAEAAAANAQGGAIRGAVDNIGGYVAYRGMYGTPQAPVSYNTASTGGVHPFTGV